MKVADIMPFSIHLSPEEKRLVTNYAHLHGISVAEAFTGTKFVVVTVSLF